VDSAKKQKRSRLFDIFSLDRSIGGSETSSDAILPSLESHVASYVKYQSPYHLMAAKEGTEARRKKSKFKRKLPSTNKTAQLARKLAYDGKLNNNDVFNCVNSVQYNQSSLAYQRATSGTECVFYISNGRSASIYRKKLGNT
jgi:hypothetical protein